MLGSHLLLLAAALIPQTGEGSGYLFSRVGGEFQPAGRLDGPQGVLLPMLTRSERVVRAQVDRRDIRLRIAAPAATALVLRGCSVHAWQHTEEQRVLFAEDGRPALASALRLPRSAKSLDGTHDWLPHLARQDAACTPGGVLTIDVGEEPCDLFLFGAEEGTWSSAEEQRASWTTTTIAPIPVSPGPHQARVLRGVKGTLTLSTAEVALDQVLLGTIEDLDEGAPLALRWGRLLKGKPTPDRAWLGRGPTRPSAPSVSGAPARITAGRLAALASQPLVIPRGHVLELGITPPPATEEGETWTLWFQADTEATSSRPIEAAAHTPRRAWFRDVAAEVGVDFVHMEGPEMQLDIRPTMGPGAAWGDANGDGWPDLYLVQGSGRAGSLSPTNRLFLNTRDGSFSDASSQSATDDDGAGMGALFFDRDADGDLDLYVANYGPDVLFMNDGEGCFSRAAMDESTGGWSAGLCAGDADSDGDLDLYITSYLDYDLEKMVEGGRSAGYRREDPTEMLPFAFPGAPNQLLLGGELLRDQAESAGVLDAGGRGMQPIFWDFDQDGDEDLYIANDVSPNVLYESGPEGLRDISFDSGMDDPRGGMGVAIGDVDADGDEDLLLTNWQLESNALYLNNTVHHAEQGSRTGSFRDATVSSGLGPAGIGVTSWGCELFDADLDGDLDLFVANGYTSPDYVSTGTCVGQPNHFFLGDGEGRFRDAGELAGAALRAELPSRCVIACDYDRDGLLDLAITANNAAFQLLHNEAPPAGHWLGVHLMDEAPNPHAIGARVTLRSGEREWIRTVRAGRSYLGGNAPELHFGLGDAADLEELTVTWPDGELTHHKLPGLDRFVTISR